MAVPVEERATFGYGTPRLIVDGKYPAPQYFRQYDVSQDGKRFLMIKDPPPTPSTPPQLVVVLNWLEGLKQSADQIVEFEDLRI